MGKPFIEELNALPTTINWANMIDISELSGFPPASNGTLVTVGSGGSQSAAIFATLLHRAVGRVSVTTTPLELIDMASNAKLDDVLIISASGSNKDIISASVAAIQNEARYIHALCTRLDSPLSANVKAYNRGSTIDLNLPTGKDGFLATNSLIASLIVLVRQYNAAYSRMGMQDLSLLLKCCINSNESFSEMLLDRPEWTVLYGGWGTPAAYDLESKLSEAALRSVQLCDLRNFAHGRHLWLAKRGERSAVICLTGPGHNNLAKKTLALLPSNVPCLALNASHEGPVGSIELMMKVFSLVQAVGEYTGIDPGRPGVPDFGRRIYHLGPGSSSGTLKRKRSIRDFATYGAARKLGLPPHAQVNDTIVEAGVNFIRKVGSTRFKAAVLDYDGTLSDASERFIGIRQSLASVLNKFLYHGLVLGIATGRGRSVRRHLRDAIEVKYWEQVIVGYYNGSQVITLNNENLPDCTSEPSATLQQVYNVLTQDVLLRSKALIEPRPQQLSATPRNNVDWHTSRHRIYELIEIEGFSNIKVLESTHSIDVIPIEVSKVSVVRTCQSIAGSSSVLCIGDSGSWPGNDCELLAEPLSLSVDTVSSALHTCWNILPPGCAGASGTLYYLNTIIADNDEFRMELSG